MNKTYRTYILLFAVATLTGCSASMNDSASMSDQQRIPPRYSMGNVAKTRPEAQEGAIYSERTSLDLYRDNRARNVGDIVLVQIVETSSGSKQAETTTERESSVSGGISALFGVGQWLGEKNRNFSPSSTNLQATLTNDFEGTGETRRNSNVTATISARVIDVTMDDNLIIRGYREVRVNNETQHIILSGIVRPEDISQDNSIFSSYISDARIEYSGTGIIAEKQQPGWLARSLDVVWPF